jgi:FkbM family methyltransferase
MISALQKELLSAKERLAEAEARLAAREDEAVRLRNRLIDLTNSSWLGLGDRLRVTRALRRIRSDLAAPSLGSSSLAGPGMMSDPPERVAFHAASTARALHRITGRGLDVKTVIDVGASNGMWSAVAREHLPQARYLLIEAQEYHREALDAYCAGHPEASYVLCAAGDQNGEVFFDDRMPFGGVASKEQTSYARKSVPMYSIDHLVASGNLPGPYLLKLDTHGFEVPILEGAAQTLTQASLVVIEVYNFRILDRSLLFDEMCAHMRRLGFGVIDISEPLWREKDAAFWQMDLFFVPLDRHEFDSNSYD